METAIELLESELLDLKKEMAEEARRIKYLLDSLINDLEKDRTYRNNVPDQVVFQLALKYARYVGEKKTFDMMKNALKKGELARRRRLIG